MARAKAVSKTTVQKDREYVAKMVEHHDVRFIRLWFTDILGQMKSVSITEGELEQALTQGIGFDGASIEGFTRIEESDMIAMPDPSTFQLLPWRPKDGGAVARMFCDILLPNGTPYEGDPRYVLKRNLKRAADMGFTFYVGPELEFYYFRSSKGKPDGLDEGGYFDQTPLDLASDLRRETVLMLEEMGIGVETSHHEVAPSQHEIDLRYTDALQMADNTMTYRLVVKEVAMKYGCYATFMPKPLMGQNGSGMHVNMSLFRGEENVFFDRHDKYNLSAVAKGYVAGLLEHAAEITLVCNQWVNSYKRLVPGYEAPVYISWALLNRSDLIRVPAYQPGRENSVRVEFRSPDPACNPYLAFAVMLAAGLEGIEKSYECPPPIERNVYEMTPQEREAHGITMLPADLHEAVQVTQDSELVRRALGDHVFTKFVANKKLEWEQYRAHVTEYEWQKYLPIL
jgi:glutamine synthetase